MDPLDPLTEIVRSGQAYSSFIFLERFIWIMIGFFFLGALSTGIKRGMKDEGWFGNKSFLLRIDKKEAKNKENSSEDITSNNN